MATRTYTLTVIDSDSIVITWTGLLNGDDGSPFWGGGSVIDSPPRAAGYSGSMDRSIEVTGTFGAAGTLVFEGTNDPTASPSYYTLEDAQGTALSFTTAKLKQILESSYKVRPRVTGGDGTTNLTVYLYIAKRHLRRKSWNLEKP